MAVGCRAKREPAPPRPAPPFVAEPLPPSGAANFEIGTITDTPSQDGHALFVQGTVRNTGTRSSRDVKVWVDGLDGNGTRVARAEALPTPQEIEPGTVGSFLVRLPNDPAIKTFHVEAIGR